MTDLETIFRSREEEFRRLAEQDKKTIRELAEIFNCSPPSISKYAKILNITLSTSRGSYKNNKKQPGEIYGCWEVIERDYNPISKSHETFYKCKCLRCGEIKSVRNTDLNRLPKCCNNCKAEFFMEQGITTSYSIGEKFGFLEIIGVGDKLGDKTYAKCRCICGKELSVRIDHLKGQGRRSRTISCGCQSMSSGEKKIFDILVENNINFTSQYKIIEFSDKMRFDFGIFNSEGVLIRLIEFDGEQHYRPVDAWGGEETYRQTVYRDNLKNEYCLSNNIDLMRIPYWEYDNITLEYLLKGLEI